MRTIPYYYPRALELEGRHPSDAGSWPITLRRLEIGEGLPKPETSWGWVILPEGEPFPSTHRPPPYVLWRNFFYRRIRSSTECDRHLFLDPDGLTHLACHLTAAWANPPGGMIPLPSEADPLLPHTHAAVVIGRIPDRRLFHFRVKWRDWGDHGTGYMPYDYFDRYVFDCWATYGRSDVLRFFKLKKLDDEGHIRWSAHDEDDHRIYAFEVRDAQNKDRHAWTFVIERDGALEIEELYVRPEFRRLGHGRWLADRVARLAREKGMPMRLWIGFADCKQESEANYAALVATARRLGVQIRPCSVSWAAYFATTEQPGEAIPIEPQTIPGRPRTPRQELLAAVLALGVGTGDPTTNGTQPTTVMRSTEDHTISVGTPEWDKLTERRAELIYKKNRQGLNEDEQAEFERLQQLSRSAINRAFPLVQSKLDQKLAAFEQSRGENEGAPKQ